SLRGFRISVPFHFDLGGCALDFAEILLSELDCGGGRVFLQTMKLCRPWNRYDPGFLGKQPGECYLSGCRVLPLRHATEQIDHCPVRLPGLRREAGDGVTEISGIEAGVLV